MDSLANYDEYSEMERFDNFASEIFYGIDEQDEYTASDIAEILSDWATDNNSNGGVLLQIAAHKEFGAKLSEFTTSQAFNINADYSVEQEIIRYIKENSHRSKMTLYRGVDPSMTTNALESWTDCEQIAEFYATRNGGTVISKEFTADSILGTWKDGIGLEAAREVIVLNR